MDMLSAILLDTVLWLALGGGMLAMLVGLLLLIAPRGFARVSRLANRWVSTAPATRLLEKPRPIERFFYRGHKVFGILLTSGAVFALHYLVSHGAATGMLAALGAPGPAGDIMAVALTGFLLAGNIVVLLVGIVVVVRPSLLKGVEAASNRWISTRETFNTLDSRSDLPDRAVARKPRLAGLALTVAGFYTTLQLGLFLT